GGEPTVWSGPADPGPPPTAGKTCNSPPPARRDARFTASGAVFVQLDRRNGSSCTLSGPEPAPMGWSPAPLEQSRDRVPCVRGEMEQGRGHDAKEHRGGG